MLQCQSIQIVSVGRGGYDLHLQTSYSDVYLTMHYIWHKQNRHSAQIYINSVIVCINRH